MILVVGATGELGTVVVRQLSATGRPVRAFVRPTSSHAHLALPHVELAFGDLRDQVSVEAAVEGATHIVTTANAIIPRMSGDTLAAVDDAGYRTLIDVARRHGVQRFVMISVPATPHDQALPVFRIRRAAERFLQGSGVRYAIVQSQMFMEDWLALVGSSIPLRGAEVSSLQRPFLFLQMYRRATGRLVEDRGLMVVPGSAERRNAFISIRDVARFLIAALDHPAAENAVAVIGGPQVLDWNDVAAIYGRLLGRPVKVRTVPAAIFQAQQRLLEPISPAAANIMALNRFAALVDGDTTGELWGSRLGIDNLRTVEQFLGSKMAVR